jgi:predicted permease
MLSSLLIRLKALVFRAQSDAELDEELRYHLDRETERNVARGMQADEARFAARRAIGNITVATDEARDSMRWRRLEELRQDVRYALRTFRRAPTFVLTVVATIGLGLGLLTAAFTLFETYVLRPNAVRDPTSLYDVSWFTQEGAHRRPTWKDYRALETKRDVFVESYAAVNAQARVRGVRLVGQLVTGNYFAMLGATPAIGRLLRPDDAEAPGVPPIIVLSHDTWRSSFGGDSSILGQIVPINGISLRVVGVARKGFGGVETAPLQFWAPITMAESIDPLNDVFADTSRSPVRMIGRLRHDVTEQQAAAALLTTVQSRSLDQPVERRPKSMMLESRATSIPLTKETIEIFMPLAVAFFLVMLIACANVANVMLARGMARQREIGVRLSLGAARGRIIRQLMTESIVLSVPAAITGYIVARAAIAFALYLLVVKAPPSFRPYFRVISLTMDGRVAVFMMLSAIVAAVGFGLVPALQSTRPSVVQATRGDFESGARPSRLRSGLVIAQVAVSALLLISAGILLLSARDTRKRDPQVRVHNIVQLDVVPRANEWVMDVIRRLPDTRVIATSTSAPIDGVFPDAEAIGSNGVNVDFRYNIVSPEYFDAVDIPLRRGRVFSDDEGRGRANVVMVSEAAAAALWPSGDPIGQRLVLPKRDGPLSRYSGATVIGIVRNARPGFVSLPMDIPVIYFPQSSNAAGMNLVVYSRAESDVARAVIEAAVNRRDSTAIRGAHTIEESVGLQLYPFEMSYWTAAIVGGVALLLTSTGVYGVLAYLVMQRRRELGVRLALGATPRGVVAMMVWHTGKLAVIGLVIGVLVAMALARLLGAIRTVFNVYDPRGFVLGVAVVLASCLVAGFVPARGAGRVDPVDALRAD